MMERDQKKGAQAGDSPYIQHDDSITLTPADDCMNGITIRDAGPHNIVVADAPQTINEVTSDTKRSDDNNQNTRHTSPGDTYITSRTLKDSIILNQPLNNIIEPLSIPVEPGNDHIDDPTTGSFDDTLENNRPLGELLGDMYKTTASEEMKQVIACLVRLDHTLTEQTRLNEAHEAHTGKNFREQHQVNKDRKLLVHETVKSMTTRLSRLEGQCMTQEVAIKQGQLRDTSHAYQIKELLDRARMLAEGGEWAEQEIGEMKQGSEDLQEQVEMLKLDNQGLRDQVDGVKKEHMGLKDKVEGLEKEVKVLKERDDNRENRLAAMEQLLRDKMERQ